MPHEGRGRSRGPELASGRGRVPGPWADAVGILAPFVALHACPGLHPVAFPPLRDLLWGVRRSSMLWYRGLHGYPLRSPIRDLCMPRREAVDAADLATSPNPANQAQARIHTALNHRPPESQGIVRPKGSLCNFKQFHLADAVRSRNAAGSGTEFST